MSQPTAYYPNYSFTQYQASHPATPLPASSVDAELFSISTSITEICNNLAIIQRSDGKLANQSVGIFQLGTDTLTFLAAIGTVRGVWATAKAYVAKDTVSQGSATYVCVAAHTSGVFATDLAANKWILVAGSSGTVTYASLSDVTLTALAADQIMAYNGSAWVNGSLVNNNITNQTIAFGKMAAAFSITDTGLAGASNTNVPTTTAVKTYIDAAVRRGTGTPVASASTLGISSTAYDFVHVTGTTTITAITLLADEQKEVIFDGILTLTHNATSLNLPSGANITTAAGDRALFRGDGTNVTCLWYIRASGKALVAASSGVLTVKRQKFTSGGTYTPSAGMLYCDMEVWGAGGGGGGVGTTNGASAAGGGAGGYARLLTTAAAVGASQTVTIGAAGASGTNSGGDGGTGGDSSVGSIATATGAAGGSGSNSASTAKTGGLGGQGSSGDINGFGMNGGASVGSSAATNAHSGMGGSTIAGKGGIANAGSAAAGQQGQTNSGSGGSGALGGGSGLAGGAGGSGLVVITEYCSQ